MPVRAGDRIDRYTLQEPLGEGGQASVWRVIDPLDGGVARALKLVPLDRAAPDAFERARREARALAKAPHPCLIACYGLFEDISAGFIGIVLDLVEGRPLREVARDVRMTHAHRIALLEQLAAALAHVHSAAIVHRDLKPDNVLVTDAFFADPARLGTVKLVDFGISAQLGNPRPLTATGAVIGTAPYLAPEDLDRGEPAHGTTSFARDLFAFGVLAYELLLGGHPTGLDLAAPHHELARAYRAAAAGYFPWPPMGLTGAWGAAIRACLALDPQKRPASGGALMQLVRAGHDAIPQTIEVRPPTSIRESHPGFTAPMTARVSAPPLRTEPGIPLGTYSTPRQQPTPTRLTSRPRLSNTLLVAGPAVVTALMVIIVGVALLRDGAPEPETAAPVMTLPLPAVVSASIAVPLPLSPEPPPIAWIPAEATCQAACCGGADCAPNEENIRANACVPKGDRCNQCASGRACVHRTCGSYLHADEAWLLRPAGAWPTDGAEMLDPRRLEICVRKTAENPWVCNSLVVAGSPEESSRLPITTEDLWNGVDIEVRRWGDEIASARRAKVSDIRAAALCRGLIIRGLKGEVDRVVVFLDDPE